MAEASMLVKSRESLQRIGTLHLILCGERKYLLPYVKPLLLFIRQWLVWIAERRC